jgi:parallel beta-helix repeat protein
MRRPRSRSVRPFVVAALLIAVPAVRGGPPDAQAACGDTVIGTLTLEADLDCTGSGLIVGADGVTIDLNGFTIEGDNGEGDVGIDNGGGFDDLKIEDGTVSGFGEGVSIGGDAENTKITGVTAFGCSGDGFDLNDSRDGTIKDCVANGNTNNGFSVGTGATGNKIEKTVALSNGGIGFEIKGTGNTLKKVDAVLNTQGIALLGTGNTVSGCTAHNNANTGVFAMADGNRISKCEATGNNNRGIDVRSADGVTVEKSAANGNAQEGILVSAGSSGAIVKKNDALGNELNGILIEDDCSNALVDGNTVSANHTDGIESENATATIKKNEAFQNGERGIQAPMGVIDGGGNEAENNADSPQCAGVVCK